MFCIETLYFFANQLKNGLCQTLLSTAVICASIQIRQCFSFLLLLLVVVVIYTILKKETVVSYVGWNDGIALSLSLALCSCSLSLSLCVPGHAVYLLHLLLPRYQSSVDLNYHGRHGSAGQQSGHSQRRVCVVPSDSFYLGLRFVGKWAGTRSS